MPKYIVSLINCIDLEVVYGYKLGKLGLKDFVTN